ncbi:hypothetical protein ACFQ3P_04590 [Paraburkholderia sabiae]|uniref:Uncharacterized protein n=1 Tax=Paraburkholderia sabiae TaxID=273251 RepID=A0ABU9QMH2_9BURK|nr:hypothetical protein [Paraburkholderia sabiae]WJZ79251.1 hypothetical protein QEN71_34795 [Paraburkholderia sabiae]
MNEIDHRILGSKLDLFHQQEEGPGMVFWHPRGWALYRVLEDYVRAHATRGLQGNPHAATAGALVVGAQWPLGQVWRADVCTA